MAAYDSAGYYMSGYWLVAHGGHGAIVKGRSNLPKQGTGFQYYYLGSNATTGSARILDAITKLNVSLAPNTNLDVSQADKTGAHALAAWPSGLAGVFAGVDVLPIPLRAALFGDAAVAGTDAGAAASGTAAGSRGAAAGAALTTGANALKGAAAALTIGSLFANIGVWKGLGMVIAGAVLVLIGILNLAGVDVGSVGKMATHA